jgi:hypothetical protein
VRSVHKIHRCISVRCNLHAHVMADAGDRMCDGARVERAQKMSVVGGSGKGRCIRFDLSGLTECRNGSDRG